VEQLERRRPGTRSLTPDTMEVRLERRDGRGASELEEVAPTLGNARRARKKPPYSTRWTMESTCDGIIVNEAPTQSPCVTRMKFRRAIALRLRYVRNRSA